jgi:hypothetical protein
MGKGKHKNEEGPQNFKLKNQVLHIKQKNTKCQQISIFMTVQIL